MIRRWLITLALLCLAVTLGYVWHRCAHTVPLAECSDIYRRYADTPGVNAAYIKDYRVNDTLTISATVLEATDSTGWETLYTEFELKQHQNPLNQKKLNEGLDVMEAFLSKPDKNIIVASHRDRYICIFYIDNQEQRRQILSKILDKILLSITNDIIFIENEKDN